MALSALCAPVKFGLFALPMSLAWMIALYPLDRRVTMKQLEGVLSGDGGQIQRRAEGEKRGWLARAYLDGSFSFYAWQVSTQGPAPPPCLPGLSGSVGLQVGVELSVSALCSLLLDLALEAAGDVD